MTIVLDIPGMRIKSGLNEREHWGARKKRIDQEKKTIWAAMRHHPFHGLVPPFLVTLTRIGPRRMDDDNVAGGFKSVRDQIAKDLRVDDGDTDLIGFVCTQQRGPYGVRITIENRS